MVNTMNMIIIHRLQLLTTTLKVSGNDIV